jgi:predicted transcriptional regulator
MQTRGFIHITYKLYFHLNRLSGQKKSNCLNVFMALMKHCWKKNNYSAGLRHMTLAKDTNLSRSTIKRSLDTLEKMNVVYSIKGRSGKTYSINQLFIKNEGLFQGSSNLHTSMSKSELPNAQIRATLVDTLEVYTIENIIRDNRGNQQAIVDNLAKLPLAELNSDNKNPYYIKLAKERKAELDRESKASYVHPQKILSELSKISKNSNPRYREKVEYNKRNNLDWKGRPKK